MKLNILYYRLVPVIEPDDIRKEFYVTSQAYILCVNCRDAIDTTGGPVNNAICLKCYKEITKQ